MSNVYYVVRHGKRIAVVDMESPKSERKARKERNMKDAFALVPLAWAANIAKAADAPDYMIFTLLAYLAWKAKSPTCRVGPGNFTPSLSQIRT
jgi:hypothetical protein